MSHSFYRKTEALYLRMNFFLKAFHPASDASGLSKPSNIIRETIRQENIKEFRWQRLLTICLFPVDETTQSQ